MDAREPDPLFQRAFEFLMAHEGGLNEDPQEPGGVTNYGISLRFLQGLPDGDLDRDGDIDADDVRGLSLEVAAAIYRREFWDRYHYEQLPASLAVKVFDLAVNMGPKQAHRLLQRALRACLIDVVEDGVIGPKTIEACVKVPAPGAVLAALRSEAAGFYRSLIARRPELARFEKGWLNRAYA